MRRMICLTSILFSLSRGSTIIFGEICVRESQTVRRISVVRCQTAIDFFNKASPKIHNQGRVVSYVFGRDIFTTFGT